MTAVKTHFLIASLLMFLGMGNAWAQSENDPNVCQRTRPTPIVFVGTVTRIDNPPTDDGRDSKGGDSLYHFRIDEKISKIDGSEYEIYSSRDTNSGGVHFQQDKQYVVFSRPEDTREITLRVIFEHAPTSEFPFMRAMNIKIMPSDKSIPPEPDEVSPGIAKLSLLRGVRYTVQGISYCSSTSGTRSQTNSVEIDGSNDSTAEITLVDVEEPCGESRK